MNAAYKWDTVKTEKCVWQRSRFTISRLPMPIIIIIYYYDYNHYYYWGYTTLRRTLTTRKKKEFSIKENSNKKLCVSCDYRCVIFVYAVDMCV